MGEGEDGVDGAGVGAGGIGVGVGVLITTGGHGASLPT